MASPFFSGRIPQELYDRVEQHIKETGEGKTQILINALSQYLGVEVFKPIHLSTDIFLSELEQIKGRLTVLEESARSARTLNQLSLLDVKPDNGDKTPVIKKEVKPKDEPQHTDTNELEDDQWLTTQEAYKLYGQSIKYETFRKLPDNELERRFRLRSDLSRKTAKGYKWQWLQKIK